jgi:hypothetical protein
MPRLRGDSDLDPFATTGVTDGREPSRPREEGLTMSRIERTRSWSAGAWFKSSRSYGGGSCVEVSSANGGIGVRDSKDPNGAQLWFNPAEWAAFVAGVRDGEFDNFC